MYCFPSLQVTAAASRSHQTPLREGGPVPHGGGVAKSGTRCRLDASFRIHPYFAQVLIRRRKEAMGMM